MSFIKHITINFPSCPYGLGVLYFSLVRFILKYNVIFWHPYLICDQSLVYDFNFSFCFLFHIHLLEKFKCEKFNTFHNILYVLFHKMVLIKNCKVFSYNFRNKWKIINWLFNFLNELFLRVIKHCTVYFFNLKVSFSKIY